MTKAEIDSLVQRLFNAVDQDNERDAKAIALELISSLLVNINNIDNHLDRIATNLECRP